MAEAIQRRLDLLWGRPTVNETMFGEALMQIPVVRNIVSTPTMFLKNAAQRIAMVHNMLKLDYNVKSGVANRLDSLLTLWPHTSTAEYLQLNRDIYKAENRRMFVERGVYQGGIRLEGSGEVTKTAGRSPFDSVETFIDKTSLFRRASRENRALGYLFGLHEAKRLGLQDTGNADLSKNPAHLHALEWAGKVEFDNSNYRAPEIFTTPLGKVFLQYKGYLVKQWRNVGSLWKNRPGEASIETWKRRGKILAAQTAFGGAKTLLSPTRLAAIFTGAGFTGYQLVVGSLSEALQQFGLEEDEAIAVAETVYYGAPGIIGQDLSMSIGLIPDLYGWSTEEQFLNLAGGPTVSMGFAAIKESAPLREELGRMRTDTSWDQINQTGQAATSSLGKFMKRTSSLGRAAEVGTNWLKEGEAKIPVTRNKDIVLSTKDAVAKMLGFNPTAVSRYYDLRDDDAFEVKLPAQIRIPVEREHNRLGIESPSVSRTFTINGQKFYLTDAEWAQYQQDAMAKIYEVEVRIIQQPAYKRLSDDKKEELLGLARENAIQDLRDQMQSKVLNDRLRQAAGRK